MNITANKFVSLAYNLNVGEGDERELMERATEKHPLRFVFGTGSMLPAFEKQLSGLKTGDTFRFTLAPEDAYGEFIEENVVELPKKLFEVEGHFDSEFVSEGNTIPMMDSGGRQLNGSVLEVKDSTVLMDFNHPLAGETLHFDGKVLDVHEATAQEIAELTLAEGCGCGCDCSGDSCDCDGGSCDCSNGPCDCDGHHGKNCDCH
jgi:FKBP-type peptidyl-prolyl cis-trans isomerase SlyD